MTKKCSYGRDGWIGWASGIGACPKNTKNKDAKFCEDHGCRYCDYKNIKSSYSKSKIKIEAALGKVKEEVCSEECKNRARAAYKIKTENEEFRESDELERELRKKLQAEISKSDREIIAEIKNILPHFWEKIKEAKEKIDNLKNQLISKKLEAKNVSQHFQCSIAIDAYASLTDSEREEWKKVYQNISDWRNLINICSLEKNFLIPLAKKYKEKEEQGRKDNLPECKKCKLRRERPTTFPAGCVGWCKECIAQKQREEQKRNNNHDNHNPPINNPSPADNSSPKNDKGDLPNSDKPSDSSSAPAKNSDDKNDNDRKRERERERQKPREPAEPPTTNSAVYLK